MTRLLTRTSFDADRAGARGVPGRIEIEPPRLPSAELRVSIEAALARDTEREAQRVFVEIENGRVVLGGVVCCWRDRQAVVDAVRRVPGVRLIDDRLHLESYS